MDLETNSPLETALHSDWTGHLASKMKMKRWVFANVWYYNSELAKQEYSRLDSTLQGNDVFLEGLSIGITARKFINSNVSIYKNIESPATTYYEYSYDKGISAEVSLGYRF